MFFATAPAQESCRRRRLTSTQNGDKTHPFMRDSKASTPPLTLRTHPRGPPPPALLQEHLTSIQRFAASVFGLGCVERMTCTKHQEKHASLGAHEGIRVRFCRLFFVFCMCLLKESRQPAMSRFYTRGRGFPTTSYGFRPILEGEGSWKAARYSLIVEYAGRAAKSNNGVEARDKSCTLQSPQPRGIAANETKTFET